MARNRCTPWSLLASFGVGVFGCGSDHADPPAPAPAASVDSPQPEATPPTQPAPAPAPAPAPREDSGADDPARGAPYPIVLLHGMAGFVSAGSVPFEIAYFAGVVDALAGAGETSVFVTHASPFASSWQRAHEILPQLEEILRRTGKNKLNLVAHSQGGLDARLLASPHGLQAGDHIASVTTLSTPHLGTPVADLALDVLGEDRPSVVAPAVELLVRLLGRSVYDLDANAKSELRLQLLDLSEAQMARVFNPTYVDDPRVHYESYAGRTNLRRGDDACAGSVLANGPELDPTSPALQATTTYIEGNPLAPTVNDGLVGVQSARYGTFVSCVPADHIDEIGQLADGDLGLQPFDHVTFYRSLVGRLRTSGF